MDIQEKKALDKLTAEMEKITCAWSVADVVSHVWQAAKASVVPATVSDIQSWIAVNSFSALDAVHDNVPIVDANELAKYIDSLDLSVSVPEGFVLMPKEPTLKLSVAYEQNSIAPISSLSVRGYKAMIEAQEQGE